MRDLCRTKVEVAHKEKAMYREGASLLIQRGPSEHAKEIVCSFRISLLGTSARLLSKIEVELPDAEIQLTEELCISVSDPITSQT
jgi:hypothetical protein